MEFILAVSYVMLMADMSFVIKTLALLVWHLGQRTLHLPRQKEARASDVKKCAKNLDRDFCLLFTRYQN